MAEVQQIITTIMIAIKGAIRDCYNFLTAPRAVSITYAQVAIVFKSREHTERLSRATCRVTCHVVKGTAQLLSLTECKSHSF